MLRLLGPGARLCDGWARRDILRVGGLGLLGAGLDLPSLLAATPTGGTGAGKAKSCILLFLMGGPPQHSTWDPKPDAPAEVRGDFGPIATNVPGPRDLLAPARHREGGRQVLPLAGGLHRRQRPLLQRLLHADGPPAPADELRERQPRRAQRFPMPGGPAGQGRRAREGACRRRSRSLTASSTPTAASGRGRMRGSSAGRATPGCSTPARRPKATASRRSPCRPTSTPTASAAGATCSNTSGGASNSSTATAPQGSSTPANARRSTCSGRPRARRAFRLDAGARGRPRVATARPPSARGVLLARRLVEAGVRLVQVNWYRGPGRAPRQPLLGQPHERVGPPQGRARPADRPGLLGPAGRPDRPRDARRDAGGLHVRVRPDAPARRQRRPGPLGLGLLGRPGRRRRQGRPGLRLLRQDRRLSPRRQGPARGPLGHDLPLPRLPRPRPNTTTPWAAPCRSAGAKSCTRSSEWAGRGVSREGRGGRSGGPSPRARGLPARGRPGRGRRSTRKGQTTRFQAEIRRLGCSTSRTMRRATSAASAWRKAGGRSRSGFQPCSPGAAATPLEELRRDRARLDQADDTPRWRTSRRRASFQ